MIVRASAPSAFSAPSVFMRLADQATRSYPRSSQRKRERRTTLEFSAPHWPSADLESFRDAGYIRL